jgi:hypothetical protein
LQKAEDPQPGPVASAPDIKIVAVGTGTCLHGIDLTPGPWQGRCCVCSVLCR